MRQLIRARRSGTNREPLQNTTIAVVATNATLTKAQATKVAQMAHDGLARAIVPAHTSGDGDAIFAMATGTQPGAADVDTIGALAADAMVEAILRAVRAATSIPASPPPAICGEPDPPAACRLLDPYGRDRPLDRQARPRHR